MLSRLGIEASAAAQYVIAFAIILVLVALFGLVLRRLTGGRLMLPGQERGRTRQPRLGVVDVYDLDRQRQLILLRRDNVEHLLLIGGPNDVVIETNIVRVAGARLPSAAGEAGAERAEPFLDRPAEGLPQRPMVEPPPRPSVEPLVAARLGSAAAGPSDAGPDADHDLTPFTARPAPPSGGRVEPVLKPDAVTLSPTAAPRAARFGTPAAPSGRSAPPRPMPDTPGPATDHGQRPAASAPPPETGSVSRDGKARDAAVLSDMAKQLEEALKRPQPDRGPEPPPQGPAQERPNPPSRDAMPRRPAPPSQSVPGPRAAEPAPPGRPEPRAPEPASPPPAAQPSRHVNDPFSVEEIEAEFARLLGRPPEKGNRGS